MELITEQTRVLGVALSGPDPSSGAIYQRWRAAAVTLDADIKPIMDMFDFDPSYLSDSGYKFLPARIWRGQAVVSDKGG